MGGSPLYAQFIAPDPMLSDDMGLRQKLRDLATAAQQNKDIQDASGYASGLASVGAIPVDKPAMERERLRALAGGSPADAIRALATQQPPGNVSVATAPPEQALRSLAATGKSPVSDQPGGGQQSAPPPEPATSSNPMSPIMAALRGPSSTGAPIPGNSDPISLINGVYTNRYPASGGPPDPTPPSQASQDAAYQRYRENTFGTDQTAAEDARTAINRMLAKDPFAQERAKANIGLGTSMALDEFKNNLLQQNEQDRAEAFHDKMREATDGYVTTRKAIEADSTLDPKAKAQRLAELDERHRQNISGLTEMYNIAIGRKVNTAPTS